MKKYISSLFDKGHIVITSVLLILFALLISGGLILCSKITFLLLALASTTFMLTVTRISSNPTFFFRLAGFSIGIVLLFMLAILLYESLSSPLQQVSSNAWIEAVLLPVILFFSLPGVLVGFSSGIFWIIRKQKKQGF